MSGSKAYVLPFSIALVHFPKSTLPTSGNRKNRRWVLLNLFQRKSHSFGLGSRDSVKAKAFW